MRIKNLDRMYSVHFGNVVFQIYKLKLVIAILKSSSKFNFVDHEYLIGFSIPFFAIMYYKHDFWGKL